MFKRRDFLKATSAAALSGPLLDVRASQARRPQRIAIVASIWQYLSHAQHMGDRFLVGYPFDGKWQRPNIEVASLYVDQKPEKDQSQERASEFGFEVYPTIAETLRCGGNELAVDAVVVICEHGDYPSNSKGQKLYPRYEFFREIVNVFEQDGRAVPVFNDKHLSYSWQKAREMVETSKRLDFPFLAGSSLPVTWRLHPLELPLGAEVEEALMVACGSSDAHDFHALEALQCMIERRKNGETGVKAVQMIEGDAVWQAQADGRWSQPLFEAALSRSDTMYGENSHPQDLANNGDLPKLVKDPAAYFIEHTDGLRSTLLMLNGAVGDYTFAARVKDMQELQSTQFFLPRVPNVTYSACLVHKIVEMIQTGKAPYPVERTQMTSALLDRCLDSKVDGHRRLLTPELDIRYKAPRESQFCQT
ncbi:MAG: hypothetical protein CMJ81_23760 [Planctomycetaceae bacterium]|nr:hypothetical protein [Planctomycetaceae bacterium]MBP61793.1 hypothetical protein [Planctomycetaceae bacterium]